MYAWRRDDTKFAYAHAQACTQRCLIKRTCYIYGGEKPIRVNEGVRVHYRYSMYITDLLIFTITLNQAYDTLCFSPLKKKITLLPLREII